MKETEGELKKRKRERLGRGPERGEIKRWRKEGDGNR